MKFKTTRKEISNSYKNVICLGYCELQNVLYYKRPTAYTCGTYGWNADIYQINDNTCIVTGYRPFGNIRVDRKITKEFEDMAGEYFIKYGRDFGILQDKLNYLLKEFLEKILKND